MEIVIQKCPIEIGTPLYGFTSLKEIDCIIIDGEIQSQVFPKLVIVLKDDIMYYRLPLLEERTGIMTELSQGDNLTAAFALSNRLVYPKTQYILSSNGQAAIHPKYHERMKILWKMNKRFNSKWANVFVQAYVEMMIDKFENGFQAIPIELAA